MAHVSHRARLDADDHVEDPDTSILHPVTLSVSTPSSPLTLVGLGVRTVSFLSVRVYSAGFYVEDRALDQLHHVPGWHVSQHCDWDVTARLRLLELMGKELLIRLIEPNARQVECRGSAAHRGAAHQ